MGVSHQSGTTLDSLKHLEWPGPFRAGLPKLLGSWLLYRPRARLGNIQYRLLQTKDRKAFPSVCWTPGLTEEEGCPTDEI